MLILNESISGWCPKTTKLGDLPNHTLEPRKPVLLVTMFVNGPEWTSCIIVCQEVVQNPEAQTRKEFSGGKNYLLDRSKILQHIA